MKVVSAIKSTSTELPHGAFILIWFNYTLQLKRDFRFGRAPDYEALLTNHYSCILGRNLSTNEGLYPYIRLGPHLSKHSEGVHAVLGAFVLRTPTYCQTIGVISLDLGSPVSACLNHWMVP